jgi:hypothetical protein
MDDACRFLYFIFLVTIPRVSRTFVKNMAAFLNLGPFYLVVVLL